MMGIIVFTLYMRYYENLFGELTKCSEIGPGLSWISMTQSLVAVIDWVWNLRNLLSKSMDFIPKLHLPTFNI